MRHPGWSGSQRQKAEGRRVFARRWGRGGGDLVFNGYGVSDGKMSKCWKWVVVVIVQQCEST